MSFSDTQSAAIYDYMATKHFQRPCKLTYDPSIKEWIAIAETGNPEEPFKRFTGATELSALNEMVEYFKGKPQLLQE